VFTWEEGRDIHPVVLRQRFNRAAQRCGLPRIRLYDLRHTYATIALKSGIHPKIISARLGHASESVTMATYQSVLPGMDRQAADTIAGLILTATSPAVWPVSNETQKRPLREPDGPLFVVAGTGTVAPLLPNPGSLVRNEGARPTRGRAPSFVAGTGFEPATSGL
jgi:hypothetical protein